jgi:cysteine desulfurase family protein
MLEKGDHAISTNIEHNSVLRPLYHQSEYNGVEVDYIPVDSKGFVDPDDFPRAFKKNTKLVIVNHASNVIGTLQPIKEIGAHCQKHGIPFAVDVSQSAGKVPIDLEEQNLDIVAFTGHKSLLGPTGIGGLYVREGIEIRVKRAGGTGVRSAVRTHLFEYPYRLEYGTINSVGVAGLHTGVKWLEEKGIQNIHEHEMKLTKMLKDGLQDVEGVTLYCQDDLTGHIGIFLFNVDGFEALNVGTLLDVDYNIASRTGLHCAPLIHEHLGTADIHGAVRFGIGPFNTEEHINTAIEAVKEIAAMKRK